MKVATAHRAFWGSFSIFFPELGLITDPEQTSEYDLIIFTGGEDINPSRYGAVSHIRYYDYKRDEIEFSIMNKALELNKKILGVCRGHQLIAVSSGGSLYQDIYTELKTDHEDHHPLEINKNNPVLDSLPKYVNSLHHQGIKTIGSNFDIIASHKEVPEIIISKDNMILGVQFHPEFMGLNSFFSYVKSWVGV